MLEGQTGHLKFNFVAFDINAIEKEMLLPCLLQNIWRRSTSIGCSLASAFMFPVAVHCTLKNGDFSYSCHRRPTQVFHRGNGESNYDNIHIQLLAAIEWCPQLGRSNSEIWLTLSKFLCTIVHYHLVKQSPPRKSLSGSCKIVRRIEKSEIMLASLLLCLWILLVAPFPFAKLCCHVLVLKTRRVFSHLFAAKNKWLKRTVKCGERGIPWIQLI